MLNHSQPDPLATNHEFELAWLTTFLPKRWCLKGLQPIKCYEKTKQGGHPRRPIDITIPSVFTAFRSETDRFYLFYHDTCIPHGQNSHPSTVHFGIHYYAIRISKERLLSLDQGRISTYTCFEQPEFYLDEQVEAQDFEYGYPVYSFTKWDACPYEALTVIPHWNPSLPLLIEAKRFIPCSDSEQTQTEVET